MKNEIEAREAVPGAIVELGGKARVIEKNITTTMANGCVATMLWCKPMRGQRRWFGKDGKTKIKLKGERK